MVLADINEGVARAAAEQLVAAGHKAIAIRCNVANEDEVAAMVEQTYLPSVGWMRLSTMPACRRPPEQRKGAILNNSSLGGLVGLPRRAAHHASPHGVIGLAKSAALEYAPRSVSASTPCEAGCSELDLESKLYGSRSSDLVQRVEPAVLAAGPEVVRQCHRRLAEEGRGEIVDGSSKVGMVEEVEDVRSRLK